MTEGKARYVVVKAYISRLDCIKGTEKGLFYSQTVRTLEELESANLEAREKGRFSGKTLWFSYEDEEGKRFGVEIPTILRPYNAAYDYLRGR